MLAAMAIAAVLCIGIGVYPEALYQLLPNYAFDASTGGTYNAYDVTHVVMQLQLLLCCPRIWCAGQNGCVSLRGAGRQS